MVMNVSLTPDLEKFVQQKVDTGRYRSSSEVVREALRLLEQKDQEYEQRLAALRAEVQKGWDSGTSSATSMQDIIARAKSRKPAQE